MNTYLVIIKKHCGVFIVTVYTCDEVCLLGMYEECGHAVIAFCVLSNFPYNG